MYLHKDTMLSVNPKLQLRSNVCLSPRTRFICEIAAGRRGPEGKVLEGRKGGRLDRAIVFAVAVVSSHQLFRA